MADMKGTRTKYVRAVDFPENALALMRKEEVKIGRYSLTYKPSFRAKIAAYRASRLCPARLMIEKGEFAAI